MKMVRVLLVSWLGLSVPVGLLMGRLMAGLRAPHEKDHPYIPLSKMRDCVTEQKSEEKPYQRVNTD